jgi:hypothetical protein
MEHLKLDDSYSRFERYGGYGETKMKPCSVGSLPVTLLAELAYLF